MAQKVSDPVAPSSRYINREQSWLEFNRRVLAEAENTDNPLLERLKFLAIFESNLDEFYMVRVSGLIEQVASGLEGRTPDGLSPAEQLQLIASITQLMRQDAADIWTEHLAPELEGQGIRIVQPGDLTESDQIRLTELFRRDVFPVCTPLMLEPTSKFPFISNRSLNLVVILNDGEQERLARIKVPPVVPRLVPVKGHDRTFVLLEDLIDHHLDLLFPGVEIIGSAMFRVVRDADIEIRELEAADLIDAIEQTLRLRRFGDPVLLEVQSSLPEKWRRLLMEKLELDPEDVFVVKGRLGMEFGWELAALDRPDLKFPPHRPAEREDLADAESLFAEIRRGDVLLHHPYDSFAPVTTLVDSAVDDPRVVGIKQTLYRVGAESPVVESLLKAADEGKQVAVMVELKARFDEDNNLTWARALEQAGAHVTYGMMDMKVHCKLCLVVRNEEDGLRTYVHMGTGNYNPSTARLYTDLGLFTCDPDVGSDVTELFNYLTGYSKQTSYRKLLVAPLNLRESIIALIEQEAENARGGRPARISFKLNSLVDPEVIDALYDASNAGVQIDLLVRGICCLRPGVPGLSEKITVVSVVGRFLEHSRIYAFERDGEPIAYIGSADMMRRNLDRRIEALVPIDDVVTVAYLRDIVIGEGMQDTVKGWICQPNGMYGKPATQNGGRSSQMLLAEHHATSVRESV